MDIHPDSEFIDAMGGTCAVARLCRIKSASVSNWRKKGIPPARRMFLELVQPHVFGKRGKRQEQANA